MTDPSPDAGLAYRTVTVAGIVIAMVLIVAVFYVSSLAFFTLFAALVLAALFDGVARLPRRLGVPRQASLVVMLILTLLMVTGVILGSGTWLFVQAGELLAALTAQLRALLERLNEAGFAVSPEDLDPTQFEVLMPDGGAVVSSASAAFIALVGGLGNIFVIIFLAAFIAWQPQLYRNGLLSFFPKEKRARIGQTMDESAHNLLLWLGGTGISMATIFVVSWVGLWLIGMPYAFLLALQAGLLAFIPTLGAFVAGVPIVLMGLSVSFEMGAMALAVYLLIQGIESNVTTPIAQRFMTALPPAVSLFVQLVFGLLFGLAGFVLAVPILAVLMVVVRNLYVEDVLGGPHVESHREKG